MSRYIDINADMGEGWGAYDISDDGAMFDVISTANLACGFHAGDPVIMSERCRQAKAKGVRIGAHPGYPDLWGFGRRDMALSRPQIEDMLAYQIGALKGVARLADTAIPHVKVHGALAHYVADTDAGAKGLITAIKAIDPGLIVMVMAGTTLEAMAEDAGLRVAREIFADRAYEDTGRLMSRARPGAVIHNPAEAARAVTAMVREQAIITASGKRIPLKGIDSICTHGDSPGAVQIAQAVKAGLQQAGFEIRAFADTLG
jgi:UPF0271 protein